MNNKNIGICVGAVFLIAVVIFQISRISSQDVGLVTTNSPDRQNAEVTKSNAKRQSITKSQNRFGDEFEWADLEDKYGAEKVELARHVGSIFISGMSDSFDLAEAQGEWNPYAYLSGMLFREDRPYYVEEDKDSEVREIIQKYRYDQRMNTKDLDEQLQKNPRVLVEALLISDAYVNGEVTKEDYDASTQEIFALFEEKKVRYPLFPLVDSPRPLMHDEIEVREWVMDNPGVRDKVRAILSPGEVEIFEEAIRNAKIVSPKSFSDYVRPRNLYEMKTSLEKGNQELREFTQETNSRNENR